MKTVIDGFEAAGQGPHQDGGRRRADQPDVRRRDRRRRLRRRTPRPRSTLFLRLAGKSAVTQWRPTRILYWQEVPSQIRPRTSTDDVTPAAAAEVHGADRSHWPPSAGCRAPTTTWRSGSWSDEQQREGIRAGRRRGGQAANSKRWPTGRGALHAGHADVNGRTTAAAAGVHALRLRRAGSASACPRPASRRQMQGVHRRDRGRHGDPLAAHRGGVSPQGAVPAVVSGSARFGERDDRVPHDAPRADAHRAARAAPASRAQAD